MVNRSTVSISYKSLAPFAFYLLLFSYPLLSLLWRRSYPLITVEVSLLLLFVAIFSLLLSLAQNHTRPVIASMMLSVLITITFMVQFNILLIGVVLCMTISFVLAWRLGTKFQIYSLPVMLTLIAGAYLDSIAQEGRAPLSANSSDLNSELPPVVHIVLDSFIGIEGLPPFQVSATLKSELYEFFDEFSFQVFPRAYSRYPRTGESLYSAMNFENDGKSMFGIEALGRREHVLTANAEFDVMEKLGYRLNVYQTGHLDFCKTNPDRLDRCWQYGHPNVASIRHVRSPQLRANMLTRVLLDQSKLLSEYMTSRKWVFGKGVAFHDPRVFSRLNSDLVTDANGRFYFAHVLLPHGPFVFMHDCSINYKSPLWARYAAIKDESSKEDHVYEARTMLYFEQVDCALKSLRDLFEEMQAAGIFEHSLIVLHGDHGSMIGSQRPVYDDLEELTPADYLSHYSTLFAVKIPGQSGWVDDRVLPVSTLLEAFSTAVQDAVTSPETPVRFLRSPPSETEKIAPYIFLLGKDPLYRVDKNIFED